VTNKAKEDIIKLTTSYEDELFEEEHPIFSSPISALGKDADIERTERMLKEMLHKDPDEILRDEIRKNINNESRATLGLFSTEKNESEKVKLRQDQNDKLLNQLEMESEGEESEEEEEKGNYANESEKELEIPNFVLREYQDDEKWVKNFKQNRITR